MAKLPTADQLKQIPLYAIVAYTVRCALRVQTLYSIDEEHPKSKSCTDAIQKAIHIATEFASGKDVCPDEAADAEEAVEAARTGKRFRNRAGGSTVSPRSRSDGRRFREGSRQ